MTTQGPASRLLSPRALDIALAAALYLVGVVMVFAYAKTVGAGYLPGDGLGVLVVSVMTLPLVFRRRAPVVTGLTVAAGTMGFIPWDYAGPTATICMLIAVYSAGAYAELWPSLAVVVAMVAVSVGYLLAVASRTPGFDAAITVNAVFSALGIVGVWGIGRAVRGRRLHTAELEQRAVRLERTQDAEVRAALAEERSRIARELHDVVAHHVSVMTVQAAGARRALERHPDRSAEALRAIESTGRSALSEMRRIVGVLRGPDADDPTPGTQRAPQPGLADLDTLAAQVRTAGVPVDVVVEGDAADVPVGVDLTAFRVVQEALTNTLKHAGPSRAQVRIAYLPGQVRVQVSDDGRGLAAALEDRRPGNGLLGMRERIALYGGTLTVGPRSGGGFEVRAQIPFDSVAV